MTTILIVTPSRNPDGTRAYTTRGALFDGKVNDRTIVTRSTQPLLDAARVLLADGVEPSTRIVMRHAGSMVDALISTIGAAAKLTVEEGERAPTFRPWKAGPHAVGTPPMRPTDRPAPGQPGEPGRAGEVPA